MSELNTAATNIYNRLLSAPTFHPASADLFTDWNMQAGDVVTVKSDSDSYQVPIYNMKLKWTGAPKVEVESTGNPEREPLPAIKRREYSANSSNYKEQKSLRGGVGQAQSGVREINGVLYAAGLQIDPVTGVWLYASEHGADYALGSSFKVQADNITAEVTRATAAEGTLSTRVQVNADGLTSATGRLTTAEGKLTTIEGSTIWQRRNEITGVVGKLEVDANDHLVIKDGAGLRVVVPDGSGTKKVTLGTYVNDSIDGGVVIEKITAPGMGQSYQTMFGTYINNKLDAGVMVSKITGDTSGTSYAVKMGTYINNQLDAGVMVQKINADGTSKASLGFYDNNTLTAGVMVQKINNDSTVTIAANRINLSGYVTASQFNALSGSFNNLVSGTTSASKLTASNGNFSNLEITNALTYGGYGDLKKKIINALSSSASGGTITISSTTLDGSAGPSVNFNIADTQFYKDAVRSAKNEGIQSVKIKANDIILDPTGTPTYYSASKKYSVPVYAEATNGESNTNGIMIDASDAWNAGKNSVTLSDTGWTQYATRTITASNGQSVIVSVPNVTVSGGSWSNGKMTVSAYYGSSGVLGSTEVALPSSASWSISYTAEGETVSCTIGGKTYTHKFTN